MDRIWVCATGTEVGKTHVACALLSLAARAGVAAVGLKPIESGCSDEGESEAPCTSDGERLRVAAGDDQIRRLYALSEPVSPHLAARRAGVRLVADAVVRWLDAQPRGFTVVETAGGLMTPLGPGLSNLELMQVAGAQMVVLVAPDRLGVLHEVSCALRVLASGGFEGALVVALSAPAVGDLSTGTNADELLTLGIVRQVVSFPRCASDDEPSMVAARTVVEAVGVEVGSSSDGP